MTRSDSSLSGERGGGLPEHFCVSVGRGVVVAKLWRKKGASSVGSCHFPVRLLHSSADQSGACARTCACEYLCVFVREAG